MNMLRSIEISLRRLKTDPIDLGFLHDFLLGNRYLYGSKFGKINDRRW